MSPTRSEITTQVFRIYIKASPEAIWEAITSPDWNARYGYHTPGEYDLRPGGAYRSFATEEMKAIGDTPDVIVDGEVQHADPPHKLVQTWRFLFTPEMEAEGFTTVTWDIQPQSDQLTKLTVTHDVTDAPVTAHTIAGDEGGGGWPWILSDLKSLLESGAALEL